MNPTENASDSNSESNHNSSPDLSDPQETPGQSSEATPQFLVVGLGASAGGIQALQEFFANVRADSDIAYVVILHLTPDHDSKLAEILQGVSPIPVTQVTQRVPVEPNHVYVVPPNQHLEMQDGHIIVSPNTQMEERRAPVDIFFRTLADSHRMRAVGVILSGTGANGSMGIKRIKERGGVAFVQNPREAEFNEMPRNSIATNLIDEVLPVAEIPAKILAYKENLGTVEIVVEPERRPEAQQQALRELFTILRVRTGHDFSNYKRPTLLRRIERRINIHNLQSLEAYVALLRDDPDEATALLKDLLISVTNFFRDKRPFEALEQEVLPRLFYGKNPEDQVRIWVAGCATGEEAYSLAMLCAERTFGVIEAPKVQIFATDIDADAIATAREGLYTLNDAADVSPERLRRFFNKEGECYRVRREIREMVLFANHNVIKDPPFSRLDMVTCRNMIIYLNHVAQERVIETFHFALNPGGYLFLGSSESVDGASDLFASVSREHHIFQSRPVAVRSYPVPESIPSFRLETTEVPKPKESDSRALERITYGDLHQQLLEQYAPPSVVVNEEYDIVHLSERAGAYLQMAGGEPSQNLLKLIRPELRLELRTALYQATQRHTNVEARNLKVNIGERTENLNIHVRPVLREGDTARGFILVIFEPTEQSSDEEEVFSSNEPVTRQLEEELIRLKAQLRASSEQHEFQAEELKASNEELQAMNEELRSAAEELETSKEELQSINEELTTVNQELKVKVEEATLTSNNLQNLINSTSIGTIFLDRSFRVNLFTPMACEIFNLIPADFGRPISDITHRLEYDGLIEDAETVLQTLHASEREVRTLDGRTWLMRLSPYRTQEDRINGVVVSFIDISERKRAQEAKIFLASIVESSKDSIISINLDGVITSWNNGAEWLYGYTASETIGKPMTMLTLPEDLKQVLANIERIRHSQKVEIYETVRTHQDGHHINLEIVLSPVKDDTGEVIGASTIARDVTERKRQEANLAFLAEVSQDLVQMTNVRETMNSLGAKIGAHFKVERVAFAEISEDEKTSVISHEWRQADLPSLEEVSRLKELLASKLESVPGDEEIAYISDAAAEQRDDARTYTALGIAALLGAPLARDNNWRFYLNLLDSAPREWREDEIELMRELTARIRTRLERARAEEALQQSEDFHSIIAALSSDWAFTARVEADGSVVTESVTEGFTKQLGYTAEELMAAGGWPAVVYPEDAAMAQEQIALLLKGETIAGEMRHLTKDGRVLWTKYQTRPVLDENGKVVRLYGASTDITQAKLAEKAVRESEERLQKALSIETVGVLFFRLDGKIQDANATAARMTGYTREELLGLDNFEILTDPEFLEVTNRAEENLAARGETPPYEKRMVRKDGSTWWGLCAPTRLAGEGRDSECVKFIINITERKRAEEALRESEARFRLLVEGAHEFAIFMLSPDNTVLTWNRGAERITGYAEAEVVGQSGEIIFTPEDRAAQAPEQEMETATREGRAPDERWHLRKNGERFWASGVLMAMRDGNDNLQGFVKVFRDATQQKQAVEKLQTGEARFRILTDALPQIIWTNNEKGEANYFNSRWFEYSGLTLEESIGPGWQAIVHPDDAPASKEQWQRALAKGEVFDTEYRLRRADGTYRWHIGRNVPLRDENGGILGWFGSATDIEDLKQVQDALWQAHDELEKRVQERTAELANLNTIREQLLERVVAVQEDERRRISRDLHDMLGQQLTALLMGLHTLPQSPEGDPASSSYLEKVAKLRDLTSDLISRAQRLAWEVRPATLDNLGLKAALEQHVEEWSERYTTPAGFVTQNLNEGERLPEQIETALYRVVQEALTNVQRHAKARNVSVLLEKSRNSITAIIEDDGKGFDPEKDEEGHERSTAGRLGLLGMAERMELVGGTLTIESKPGKGTTVYARVPLSNNSKTSNGKA